MFNDLDIFGNPKKVILSDEEREYLRNTIRKSTDAKIPPKIYTKTGIKTFSNPHYQDRKIWFKFSKFGIFSAITIPILLIISSPNEAGITPLVAPLFILGYDLLNKPKSVLDFITLDFDNKKIIAQAKKMIGFKKYVELDFYEIELIFSHKYVRSIVVSVGSKSICIDNSNFGLESPDFENLHEELRSIEFQNVAWWRNINSVFPNV